MTNPEYGVEDITLYTLFKFMKTQLIFNILSRGSPRVSKFSIVSSKSKKDNREVFPRKFDDWLPDF